MDDSTRAVMQEIAREAATEAVKGTLTSLGVDHSHPLEAQQDMHALRDMRLLVNDNEFQADMLYLRKFRKAMDGIQAKGITAAIGMVCMSALVLVVYTFKG